MQFSLILNQLAKLRKWEIFVQGFKIVNRSTNLNFSLLPVRF